MNYQWYQFKDGVYLSWRTPYDPEKATNEYSKSNKMCPDIEGFIMNPKPTRVKKKSFKLGSSLGKKSQKDLVKGKYHSMYAQVFLSKVYAPYVESIIV